MKNLDWKLLVFIFILFLSNCRVNKEVKSLDTCQLIDLLLKDKAFCEIYSFNICNSDTIKFIDNNKIFRKCYNKRINNSFIINVEDNYIPTGYLSLKKRRKYYTAITIDKLIQNKDTVILFISRNLTNHDGEFKYIKKKNKYEIVKHRVGQY